MTVWSENPALEGRLRELVAKGVTAGSIARTLKINRNQVIGKVTRLGLRLAGGTGLRAGKTRAKPEEPFDPRAFAEPSPPRRFSWQDPVE